MSKPKFNTPLAEGWDFLMTRRSVRTRDMIAPGPDRFEMQKILQAAMRVPDHGKLSPWRFIVLDNETDQDALGVLISAGLCQEKDVSEKIAAKMHGYAKQAPVLVVAIYSPCLTGTSVPLWEQELSAGAACMNMLTAATAMGFGGQWLTGWAAYSDYVAKGLSLTEGEKIAGFMFFGTASNDPSERPRPDPADHIQYGVK